MKGKVFELGIGSRFMVVSCVRRTVYGQYRLLSSARPTHVLLKSGKCSNKKSRNCMPSPYNNRVTVRVSVRFRVWVRERVWGRVRV
jgi:hypothetical protein